MAVMAASLCLFLAEGLARILPGGSDEFTMSRSAVACMACQQVFWPKGLGGLEAQCWCCAAAWNSIVRCFARSACEVCVVCSGSASVMDPCGQVIADLCSDASARRSALSCKAELSPGKK